MRWSLLAALVVLSCTSRVPQRCDNVCAREDECAEELRQEFDRAECVETCLAVEREERGRAIIERHAACVLKAASCAAVMACE